MLEFNLLYTTLLYEPKQTNFGPEPEKSVLFDLSKEFLKDPASFMGYLDDFDVKIYPNLLSNSEQIKERIYFYFENLSLNILAPGRGAILIFLRLFAQLPYRLGTSVQVGLEQAAAAVFSYFRFEKSNLYESQLLLSCMLFDEILLKIFHILEKAIVQSLAITELLAFCSSKNCYSCFLVSTVIRRKAGTCKKH